MSFRLTVDPDGDVIFRWAQGGGEYYCIPRSRFDEDWLGHMSRKTWVTPGHLRELASLGVGGDLGSALAQNARVTRSLAQNARVTGSLAQYARVFRWEEL